MDPEARVVVTATNETDAAFRSADRNLQQFQRSVRGIRQIASTFGVVFSARAFLGWIEGAVKAADASGEYAETVKATKDAVEAMKKASDSLALSIATGLTPAMEGLTAVFTGWNRIISGADPFPYEAQIEKLRTNVTVLKAQLFSSQGMPKTFLAGLQKQIDDTNKAIDDLIAKQEKALGVGRAGTMSTLSITDAELAAVEETLAAINNPYARHNMITQEEEVALEGFVYGFKQANKEAAELDAKLEEITGAVVKMPDELVKLPAAYNAFTVAVNDSSREIVGMQNNFKDFAQSLGRGLKDSFVDAFMGVEVHFQDLLKRMAVEAGTSALFKGLSGLFAASTGGVGKFFADFFGGFRAKGGPLDPGKWYIAGEKGPEPVWGGGPGAFAAGYGGGSGVIIHQTNTFHGGDQRQQAAAIAANNARLKQQVKAELVDARRRGRPG